MPTVNQGIYRWLFKRGATLEDFADRLNHYWTCGLLLVLACIVSWKQGSNKPMVCWCPAEFTDCMVEYTENTCWNSHRIDYPRDVEQYMEARGIKSSLNHIQNVPLISAMPISGVDHVSTVTLYQWLPVLLCFQALLFKLPNTLMYLLHGLSGVSFNKLACLTRGYSKLNLNEREKLGRQTGRYVYNWCKQFENCLPWRLLTLLWFVVKVLYCVNIITQMFLIDSFLKTTDPPNDNSTSYGDVMADNLFENNATLWKHSPVFPRLVLCNFLIRQLIDNQQYLVQCELSVNEFNERAYMFLWVWLLMVAVVTCLSFVVWLSLTLIPLFRKRYITNILSLVDDIDINSITQLDLKQFVDLIGEDGVMTLNLIGANSSEHVVLDVVRTMWRMRIGDRPGYGSGFSTAILPDVRVPIQPSAPENDKCD